MIKIIFLFLIFAQIYYLSSSANLTEKEKLDKAQKIVDKANAKNKGKWIAKLHHRIAKLEKHSVMLGAKLKVPKKQVSTPEKTNLRRKRSIPASFDVRTGFSSCAGIVGMIQDQSSCGDCWAVSTASALTDRYCISQVKKGNSAPLKTNPSVYFSALELMSCTPGMSGCGGGDPYYAWKYTQTSGLVTGTNYTWNSGCKPYPFPPHGSTEYTAPSCVSSCTSSAWNVAYTQDKKYTKTTGYIQSNVAAIQNEIMANGSVVAAFDVYDDFMYYSSGQTSDVYVGGHAVRMIGWGTDTYPDGTSLDYWLCANQWNYDWGMNGYFKIARGVDECGIESSEISFGTF
uniref:Peptidase C1A papain C-terminal domain-containing protein n=1 Tax=Meloidogyne incognita TaxID=6306 RepID=A0A914MHN7_MELIC